MDSNFASLAQGSSLIKVCQDEGRRVTLEGCLNPPSIQAIVASHFCQVDMTVNGRNSGYLTRFECVHLGSVEVIRYSSEGMQRGVRRWAHIREDRSEFISLYMPLSMDFIINNGFGTTRLSPGHFSFLSTHRPFSLVQHHDAGSGYYSSIYVKIPAAKLRARVQAIDDLLFRSLPVEAGEQGIMQKVIEAALIDGPALSEGAGTTFGEIILDSIALAAERVMKAESPSQNGTVSLTSRARILLAAKQFIDEHISDHGLDVGSVAEHCGVSARYLHTAFSEANQSVADYIRERRLRLCQDALRDPRLRHRAIARIADDWGFSDPSYFSRLYRTKFGLTPRQERNTSHAGAHGGAER